MELKIKDGKNGIVFIDVNTIDGLQSFKFTNIADAHNAVRFGKFIAKEVHSIFIPKNINKI